MSAAENTLRRSSRWIAVAAVLVAAGVLLAPRAWLSAEERNSAEVSFLDGRATAQGEGGEARVLARSDRVFEGEAVETAAGARLELKVADGSVVRVGPSSKLLLRSAHFGQKGDRKFSAKLAFGRAWSKVTGVIGGEAKFEVETDNAVAGVRGTTFRVDARTDSSVLVRVYAGSVAMAPGAGAVAKGHKPGKAGRVQVAGPKQITRQEWEVLVGRMMSLVVNADGTPGEPIAFTEEEEADDVWVQWNRARDEQ